MTIVDPACPAPAADPPQRPPRARRSEQVLGLALVLLLLAAAVAGSRLRADARVTRLLAASDVRAELVTGRVAATTPTGGTAITALRVTSAAGPDLPVVAVRADLGWEAQVLPDAVLRPGGELLVGLERPVTCSSRPRLPSRLSLTLAVPGTDQRTVVVPVRGTAYGVREQAAVLCGDLDARDAVIVTGSSARSDGDGTLLELALANRSTSPARVLGGSYAGFQVTFTERLPLVLAGRPPGPSDGSGLSATVLRARVRLVDCGAARAALDRAARQRPPDLLDVDVDGRGGPGVAQLDVRGLLAYLEGDWQEACR